MHMYSIKPFCLLIFYMCVFPQVQDVFKDDRNRCCQHGGQAVLQRGANQVFRAQERKGVQEVLVVGQVPQVQAPEAGLPQGQPLLLKGNPVDAPYDIFFHFLELNQIWRFWGCWNFLEIKGVNLGLSRVLGWECACASSGGERVAAVLPPFQVGHWTCRFIYFWAVMIFCRVWSRLLFAPWTTTRLLFLVVERDHKILCN